MPVIAIGYAAAQAGVLANINYTSAPVNMDLPTGIFPILERPSFAESTRSESRLYIAGGLNDNCMVTDQDVVLRQYITPISRPMVLDATPETWQIGIEVVAGTGISGSCIFFLRWRDPINKRRSPLSAGSPTIVLTGTNAVKFYNIETSPSPQDDGVTHLEWWVNVDGEIDSSDRLVIRRLATRTIGAATYTISEAIEYEAEEEYGLARLPRVRFNEIYHARMWTSGDVANPSRIYFSPLERFSEYTKDSYLETLNGEPVTALKRVRDVLCVFCPHSSYYITGYSETDFEMNSLEPGLGCITHHGIGMLQDIAIVPAHQGLYACTGTSMKLLDGDYSKTWTEKYNANPLGFENGFGITDTRAKVYKFFEETVTVSAGVPTYEVGRFWVFDYQNFSEADGGNYSPPFLSFDIYATRARAAAMVAPPGSPSANCYQAFASTIYAENNWTALDSVGARTTKLQIPVIKSEPGGGPNDGLKFLQGWMYVSVETFTSWLLEMTHGPDRASVRDTYSWILGQIAGIPIGDPGKQIVPSWANWAKSYSVASITRVATTATVTTVENHNLVTGDVRAIAGANEVDYNGSYPITVTGLKTFTYTVAGAPATPATGTITVEGQIDTFSPESVPFRIEVVGEGLSLILSIVDPIGLVWSGYGFTSNAGKKYLAGSGG